MDSHYYLSENTKTITLNQIKELICKTQREDSFIDYKGSKLPRKLKLSDVICSFLNSHGGHIVFGIREKNDIPKEIVGISKKELSNISDQLSNIRPHIDLMSNFCEITFKNDLVVAVLFIPRYKGKWYHSSAKFYIRKGSSSIPLQSQAEIDSWKHNHPENLSLLNVQIRKTYLEKLTDKFRRMSLFGLPIEYSMEVTTPPLPEIYVPVGTLLNGNFDLSEDVEPIVESLLNKLPSQNNAAISSLKEISVEVYKSDDFEIQYLFFGLLLHSFKRFVILGAPGSGKSTFLHFLVWCFSTAKMNEYFDYNAQLIPFYIELKSYSSFFAAQKEKGEPYSIIDFLCYSLENTYLIQGIKEENKKFILDSLSKGSALVLFDAVDEIGNATSQREISSMIQSFAREYPNAYLVVTSRVLGYNLVALPQRDFTHLTLMPLRQFTIRKFISQWYDLIEEDKQLGTRKTKALIGNMNNNSLIFQLASNPLILTLMVLMTNFELTISSQQYTLYSQLSKTFLHSREAVKEIDPAVSIENLEQIFAYIAFSIQQEIEKLTQTYEIPRVSLREKLVDYFSDEYSENHIDALNRAKKFIAKMDRRPIMLLPRENYFSFWHRSFQDYYTALYLRRYYFSSRTEFWNLIQERINNYNWWEIFQLTIDSIGEMSRKEANAFSSEFLRNLKKYEVPGAYLKRKIIQKSVINKDIKELCIESLITSLKSQKTEFWMAAIHEAQFLTGELSDEQCYQIMKILLSNPSKFQQTMQIGTKIVANPFMNLLNQFFFTDKQRFLDNIGNILSEENLVFEALIYEKLQKNEIDFDLLVSILSFRNLEFNHLIKWHGFRILINKQSSEIESDLKDLEKKLIEFYNKFPIREKKMNLFYLKLAILFKGKALGKNIAFIDLSGAFSEGLLLAPDEKVDINKKSLTRKEYRTVAKDQIGLTLVTNSINNYFKDVEPIKTHVRHDYRQENTVYSLFSVGFQFKIEPFKDFNFPIDIKMVNEYYKEEPNVLRFRLILVPEIYTLAFRYVFSDQEKYNEALVLLRELKDKTKLFHFSLIEKEEFYNFHRALKLFKEKDYTGAEQYASQAIELCPRFQVAYRIKAESLANAKQYQQSQRVCEEYISQFKEDKWVLLQSILNNINLWKNKEALAKIKKFQSYNFELNLHEETLLEESKGIALYRDEREEEAIKLFNKIISKSPDRHRTSFHKASALVLLEKYEDCMRFLDERYSNDYQEYPLVLIPRLIALINLNLIEEAVTNYFKLRENNLKMYFSKEEPNYEVFLRKVLEKDPKDVFSLISLALILKQSGEKEEARIYFKKAIETHPNHPRVLNNYAIFLKEVDKDYDKAEECYQRAIKMNPNCDSCFGNYANFLGKIRKDYNKAQECYQRAININPNNAYTQANYAGFLLARGEDKKGFLTVKNALELVKEDLIALECYFYIYAHTKEKKRREESLIKIKELISWGIRSPDWNLEDNVSRALKDNHPSPKFLKMLAKVISIEISEEKLSMFGEWSELQGNKAC